MVRGDHELALWCVISECQHTKFIGNILDVIDFFNITYKNVYQSIFFETFIKLFSWLSIH